jgi:hypothetical protein
MTATSKELLHMAMNNIHHIHTYALIHTYRSSSAEAPPAILDGDCRLTAQGADNLLTEAEGTIKFDAIDFMQKKAKVECMGWDIRASRLRWVSA